MGGFSREWVGQGNHQQEKSKSSWKESKSSGDNGFLLAELWYFDHWLIAGFGAG